MQNHYSTIPPLEDVNDIQYLNYPGTSNRNFPESLVYTEQIREAFDDEARSLTEYANSIASRLPESQREQVMAEFLPLIPLLGKLGAMLIPKATAFIAKAAPKIAQTVGSAFRGMAGNLANRPYQNIQQGAQYAQDYGQQLPQQFNNLMNQPLQNVIPQNVLNQPIGNIIPQQAQDLAGRALNSLSSLLNNDTIRTLINNLANPQPGVLNYGNQPPGNSNLTPKEAFGLINDLSSYANGNIPSSSEALRAAAETINRAENILSSIDTNNYRY